MGRELVLKRIKRSGIALTIFGALFTAFPLLSAIAFAIDGSLGEYIVIMLIMFIPGVLMLVFGIKNLTNPMGNGMFKRNPNLLAQVDNMATNKRYEDKFIMLSDRCIANKKSFTEIAYLEDVFLVYIQRHTTNLIPTGKILMICTATGNIGINVYGCKKATIDELASKISKVCPNARFGYNNEGLAYLKQMQQIYNNNNGMINHRGFVQNMYILPEYMNNANLQNQMNQNQYYQNDYNQNSYNQDVYYQNNQNTYNQF
ncbi:MAG: hypothetical protein IKJ73_03330 [Lachnospiraceae bacterium]|nr:hypothetical protein [Lachnospiraceae bacterium]